MSTSSETLNIRLSLATILIAGLFITGCGQGDDTADQEPPPPPQAEEEVTLGPDGESEDDAESDDDATGDQTTGPDSSTDPVGEFSTELQQSDDWPAFGDTQGIYPVEVTSAIHDGFERIVIEHAGTGTPSYMAQYTDDPVEPGRGEPIDTGDEAYLEVIASGTASIDDIDEDQMIENGAETTDLETEATGTVVSFAPWEATSNYIIGLDEQRPYAVTIIEDPVRIVIDIQLDVQQ